VVNPGQDSYLSKLSHWNIDVLIKPLLQGNSRGIDEYSIVEAADTESIKFKVKQIHKLFNEPALIEAYIGGSGARELSIPLLLSFDGGVGELPIVEIDLLKIPSVQGKYRYLTREIKAKGRYQKNQVELSQETRDYLYAEVARIINEIGCKDMTRVDLRSDSTGLYFIEVNVNPCKTKFNSSLITSAYSLGLKYEELIAFIPYQAMMKYGIDPPTKLEELVEPVNKLIEQSNVGEYSHTQFVDQQI
jgi:D-alanine-D-alanine ligase